MCMQTKLNKVNKSNLEIEEKLNENGRTCMLSYCNGKLDKDFKCLIKF